MNKKTEYAKTANCRTRELGLDYFCGYFNEKLDTNLNGYYIRSRASIMRTEFPRMTHIPIVWLYWRLKIKGLNSTNIEIRNILMPTNVYKIKILTMPWGVFSVLNGIVNDQIHERVKTTQDSFDFSAWNNYCIKIFNILEIKFLMFC